MNIMLLAAGEGRRLQPYTLTRPKPAMPFLNIPLAAYALSFLSPIEEKSLVANTFHLPSQIHHLFSELKTKVPVQFSDESILLGSGGGLKAAERLLDLDQPIILMNADEVILPVDQDIILKALEEHQRTQALSTLIVTKHPEAGKKFGGVWTEQNKVLGFGRNPIEKSTEVWHFIGAQILSPRIFRYLPEGESNILYDSVTAGINQSEHVQIFPIECEWFETGNPTDYLEAQFKCLGYLLEGDSFQKRFLEKTLRNYSTESFIIEERVDLKLFASQSAEIKGQLSGFAVIGSQSNIESGFAGHNIVVAENIRLTEKESDSYKVFI